VEALCAMLVTKILSGAIRADEVIR
jgi:hypothetical protein